MKPLLPVKSPTFTPLLISENARAFFALSVSHRATLVTNDALTLTMCNNHKACSTKH